MTRDEEIWNAIFNLRLGDYNDNLLKNDEYSGNDLQDAFYKGAKWADEHPNRWISVEDRLPKQNKKVIVICEKLDTAPFYKISLGHIVDKTISKDNYNGWDIPNVVYWTPMPKLPEEI